MASSETINHENQIGLNYLIRNQFSTELIEDALNRHSIELNYQNQDGDTALDIAVKGCNKEIIDLLVRKGACVDIKSNSKKSEISIAPNKFEVQSPISNHAISNHSLETEFNEPTPSTSINGETSGLPIRNLDNSIVEGERRKIAFHSTGGIRHNLHGVVFQLKLLRLFAQRAKIQDLGPFQLATEFDPAEKFDDIVFINQNTRFLQAKHKLNCKENRITIKDLLSTSNKDPFSIQKYFISFCKIKSNKKWFENSELSNFTIITNTDFDSSGELSRHLVEENDLKEDTILYIEKFTTKKYKLNPQKWKEKLKMNLLRCALNTKIKIDNMQSIRDLLNAMKFVSFKDLITKAKEAVEKLSEGSNIKDISSRCTETLKLQEKIYGYSEKTKQYHKIYGSSEKNKMDLKLLIEKLKIPKKRTTSLSETKQQALDKAEQILNDAGKSVGDSEKILNEYNSAESKEDVAIEKAESELKQIKEQIFIANKRDSIEQEYEKPIFKLNVPKMFYNDILKKSIDIEEVKKEMEEKLEHLISELSIIRLALRKEELDSLSEEFFDKFHFVTNYPNEKDLGNFVDAELNEFFNLLKSDLLGAALERRMLNFLKFIKENKAPFFTSGDIDDYFDKLKEEVHGLMASGLHQLQVDELRLYGIRFKENPEELKKFIDQKDVNSNQIFHFVTTTPRLSAIKVLDTIEASTRYRECNSYIFTTLKKLLIGGRTSKNKQKGPMEIILHAFQSESSHSLLVLEEEGYSTKRGALTKLFGSLSRILSENPSKKLILVAKSNSTFGKMDVRSCLKDEISFEDLDAMSQNKVLDKKVNFQDRDVIKLNDLIDETSAVDVFDQEILSEFIVSEKKTPWKIGNNKAFFSIDYAKDFYIPRKFQRNDGTIREEVDFCGAEIWNQKIVIVANEAGMGKSTMLTSIANKMKDHHKHLWIVRLNLNHYKADKRKSKSLCKINFAEDNTEGAIEFVIKMISIQSKKKPVQFQRNLFKLGLQNSGLQHEHEVRKPKIILMFDGFDEVSRSENETTTLIKALNTSQVAQIWVSTRTLKKLYLEEKLGSPVHTLVPLSDENQVELSSGLWKHKLKFKESISGERFIPKTLKEILDYFIQIMLPEEDFAIKLRDSILGIIKRFRAKKRSKKKMLVQAIDDLDFSDYIKKLNDHWKAVESVEGKDLNFTSNPLHLKMLIEVIYDNKFNLLESFGLFNLYEEFVKIKFKIFYKIKGRAGDYEAIEDANRRDLENVRNIHCGLSVKVFTDDVTCKALPNFHSKCEVKYKQEFDRIGFLKLDEQGIKLEFIHRSYAEFFCSDYLTDNLDDPRVQELAKNLVVDDNKLLRHFFEKNPSNRELKIELFPERMEEFC